jgi:hypothetical protein
MAIQIFKTLENRYIESVDKLYAGATQKFDGGKSSNGRNDDPLIVRAPAKGYWNVAESRSTPVASTFNDIKRLTLFTASVRGASFILKQQLLQTGNTFQSTRIINPVFHISNAVPFTHTKRMIDIPITGRGIARALLGNNAITRRIFGGGQQKTDVASLRKIAQLQQETYNKAAGKKDLIGGVLKKIPVIGQTVSAVRAKRSMGEVEDGWTNSRPELSSTGYIVYKDRSNKTKFEQNQTTTFRQRYGPNILGLYDTYLTATDSQKKKWYLGQQLNSYSTLRTLVSTRERLTAVGLDPTTPSSPSRFEFKTGLVQSTERNGLAEKYSDSKDRAGLFVNQALAKYIDYGTAVRYKKEGKQRPDTRLQKPLIVQDIFNEQSLEKGLYEKSVEKSTLKTEAQKYFLDVAKLEKPDQAITSGTGTQTIAATNRSYIRYFNSGKGSIRTAGFKEAFNDGSTNAKLLAEINREIDENLVNISYLRDPLNSPTIENDEFNPETIALKPYKNLRSVNHMVTGDPPGSYIDKELGDQVDPVVVSFAMGRDDHIQFRAFIRDLQQTATPQYKDYQYIGRIEKFISYVTVQREISFKLDIIAFSKEELDIVWKRINYITGLVFPYGINKGILQPNIVRLTIGQVYTDQPGYITSLDTTFSDLSPSWDIDKQVPINATMNIRFKLIEKNVALADSPFYGINEGNSDFDRITQDETTPA